ncbi:unnamed protein product, partial [marine sediment metagenome]
MEGIRERFAFSGIMMLAGAWTRILLLTLLHFLVDFYGGLLTPLLEPTLIEHLSTSLGSVTLLLGIGGIVVNASQPVSGALLPKKGFPPLLIIAPIAASLITCIGLTHSFAAVGALIIIAFLGIGLFHPEGLLAVQDLSGSRQGFGTAFFLSGGFMGYSFGSWIGGAWASKWKLSGFWFLAVPAAAGVLIVLVARLHRMGGHLNAKPLAHARHTIRFPRVLALTTLIAVNVSIIVFFVTPYLVRRFGPKAQYWGGTALLAFGVAAALGSYLWGFLSERRSRCLMIAVTQIIALPFLYLLLNVSSPNAAPVWAGALGFFVGGIFPVAVVLGRGSPGEPTRLRAGLLIGGSWGTGSVVMILAGKWI